MIAMQVSSVRQRGALIAGLLMLAGLAAACGSSGSSTPTSSSTGGGTATGGDAAVVAKAKADLAQYLAVPNEITQSTPLPSAPPKGKSIIFLSQSDVPNVVAIGTGGIAAAKSIGWSASAITYDPSSPASLQAAFSSALIKHPTAVVVTGSDPATFGSSTLAAYKAANIPIIVTDEASVPAGLLGNPGGPEYFTAVGKALADWFVADSGGTGSVLLAHVPAFPTLNVYNKAFTDQVNSLCPDCKVQTVDISVSQLGQGQTASVVVAALRKSPSTKYVIFDDGSFASGINSALSAAGLSDIKIGGVDGDADNLAAIRSGTQQAWITSSSYNSGYASVDIALRYVEKAPISTDDLQPFQLITKDNIGSLTTWSYPANAAAQYLKLWGVAS
jgi:ribose transport system substrate-binding protein